MGLNREVLRRAGDLAWDITCLAEESRFIDTRYTGRALEKDHLVAPELTNYGLKEKSVLLPPFIAMHNMFIQVLENPRSAELLNSTMAPMVELASAILDIEPLPNNEVVRTLREERNQWQDILDLNKAKKENSQSVRIIDWAENIVK